MAEVLLALDTTNYNADLGSIQGLIWDGSDWVYQTIDVDISGDTDWIVSIDALRQVSPRDQIKAGATLFVGGNVSSSSGDIDYLYKWAVVGGVPKMVRVASFTSEFPLFGQLVLTTVADDGAGGLHLSTGWTVGHWPGGSAYTRIDGLNFNFDTASGEVTNWTPQVGGAGLVDASTTKYQGKLNLYERPYLFEQNGYLWTLWGRAEYTHRFTGAGTAWKTGWVAALARTDMPSPGTALTSNYYRDNTVVVKIFTPYHTPTTDNRQLTTASTFMQHSAVGTLGAAAAPPVYWPTEDCYFLPITTGTLYDPGTYPYPDGDTKDWLYLMKPDGSVYPALDINTSTYSAGLVNSGWSGGVYYHAPTDKVYAFYYTAFDIMEEPATSGLTAWFYMYRLDSYDLSGTPTFSWTLVQGEEFGYPVTGSGSTMQSPSGLFSITSDAENIYICWTATNPGKVYRLHLATEELFVHDLPSGWSYPALVFARVKGAPAVIQSLGAGIIG